jgi:small conductance mechanosensitive channel
MQLSEDPKWKTLVLDKPEIWGIESISAEAVIVRIVMKTRSGEKDNVARELRARLKNALDAMGVHLPALNTVVLSGFEGASSVKGARTPKTAPVPAQPVRTTTKTSRRRTS